VLKPKSGVRSAAKALYEEGLCTQIVDNLSPLGRMLLEASVLRAVIVLERENLHWLNLTNPSNVTNP
jgi:hypothetical protein